MICVFLVDLCAFGESVISRAAVSDEFSLRWRKVSHYLYMGNKNESVRRNNHSVTGSSIGKGLQGSFLSQLILFNVTATVLPFLSRRKCSMPI